MYVDEINQMIHSWIHEGKIDLSDPLLSMTKSTQEL